MLSLALVADLVKVWALTQTLKKLREYASSPVPDVQFTMPLVGAEIDVWIVEGLKPPYQLPKRARRIGSFEVEGVKFYLFAEIKGKKAKLP